MNLFELSATLGLDTSGFGTGITNAMNMLGDLTDFAEEKFKWLGNLAVDFGKDVLQTGMGFDQAMSNVQAVLGKEEGTVENMNELRAFALDQAKDSIFTAEETANAYYYMGMAGWKSAQMQAGLPGVMALAAATGEDLARVSDIVTDNITAFGLSAYKTSDFVDVLAQTATNSNTDVIMMGQAFKYAAANASAMGYDYKDVALALGLMANAGVKSGMAGRALRNVFSRIAKPTKESGEAIHYFNLATLNADGSTKSFRQIMEQLRAEAQKNPAVMERAAEAARKLTEQYESGEITEDQYNEKMIELSLTSNTFLANVGKLAGAQGMAGLLSIIMASDEEFEKLAYSIDNASGAAQNMADVRMDNLQGDFDHFNSTLDVIKNNLFDDVRDPLRSVVQEGTEGLDRINNAIKEDGVIGGLKQLTEELRNIKENETFKEFLKSAGEAGGEILSIITTDVLPGLDDTVVSLGHSLGEGLMGGISDSLPSGSLGAGMFGLLSNWFGTDMSKGAGSYTGTNPMTVPEVVADKLTINDVEVSREDIQKALDETGGEIVTIAGVEMNRDWAIDMLAEFDRVGNEGGEQIAQDVNDKVQAAAPGIGGILSAFVGDAGSSAGSLFSALFANNVNAEAPGLSNDLANTLGDAGSDAGRDIVSGIKTALSFAKFTVSVAGIISGIFNTNKNASAMSSGRIYNKPTIFGYADNAFQIAGDAGSEAVVGTNSLYSMITSAVNSATAGQEVVVPRDSGRDITIILEVDRQQFARTVYKANNEETQRVGVRLGGAY